MSTKHQPKLDKPHAGVDRRRNDMAGRKYAGTKWSAPVPPHGAPKTPKKGH
jgi:hypothetical protein